MVFNYGMKEIIFLPFAIILEFIEDFVVRPAIDAVPPLLIIIIAIAMFFSNGCLPKIGGILLFIIGIIITIIWLLVKIWS